MNNQVNLFGRLALATDENFDEAAYLAANPDVAAAVRTGEIKSGLEHFKNFGAREGRKLRVAPSEEFRELKRRKLRRIEPLLLENLTCLSATGHFDFLTSELRDKFNIVDTQAVSSNEYDGFALGLIEKHRDGLVLDCGAGYRPVYYSNVVNFEIADYDTTDVRGVGEALPFKNGSFDAALSLAVLEHVKDPFACARELVRVLKPGGDLICCVPFLQPLHGYPHHYYNMTAQGLANLFGTDIEVDQHLVYDSVLPIWSLAWILRSWADGLAGQAREEFENLQVKDLLHSPETYLGRRFVRELSTEKNFELASATVIFGRKRVTDSRS
jgi:SAM-dependent methyltransferase